MNFAGQKGAASGWNGVRARGAAALAGGLVCGLFMLVLASNFEWKLMDMAWAWHAARDLVTGRDPYRHPLDWGLVPYPLTAAVLVLPLAWLPGAWGAALLFFGVGSGLVWGLTRGGQWWRLLLFLGPSFLMAMWCVQWSPLLLLALLFPALGAVVLAKPTLGAAVAVLIPWTRGRVTAVVVVAVLSLAWQPDWPLRWLAGTAGFQGFIPVWTLPGVLLLLAARHWRKPEARLLLLLAFVPQHSLYYDQLLLWMIPRSRRQMLLLSYSAWVGLFFIVVFPGQHLGAGPWIVVFFYLPCLVMVYLNPTPEGGAGCCGSTR